MTTNLPKGREQTHNPPAKGGYVVTNEEGVSVLTRGKYANRPVDQVPRGYVREYVLRNWRDSMTDEEIAVLEKRIEVSPPSEQDGPGSPPPQTHS